MRKFFAISLILFLILMTAIIKNSTKRIDDEIFTFEENIRDLNKNFGKIKLEHEYLSSSEKLIELQELYFDDRLIKKNIKEIKIINQKLEIKNLD
tara:strand:+ start:245 stop:529 length:285 start_codon:yes stop_codon:yes gene_type:complete